MGTRSFALFRCLIATAIIAILTALPAKTQITFDSTASGSTISATTLSWNHTIGGGANRILVVGLASTGGSATLLTYGGQPLSRQVVAVPGSLGLNSEIWTLLAPPSGTALIIATFSHNNPLPVGGSVSFSGVDQSTPVRAANAGLGVNPGTISTTVASAQGDVVLDAVTSGGGNWAPAMGQALQWSGDPTLLLFGGGSTRPGASGSTTMSWSFLVPGSFPAIITAISLIPAQGPVATPIPATLWLVCMGLGLVAIWRWRYMNRASRK